MGHQVKKIPSGIFFCCIKSFGDSNSERARSVKKTCQWQVFSERVAQSGTVSQRVTVDKQDGCEADISPMGPPEKNDLFRQGVFSMK